MSRPECPIRALALMNLIDEQTAIRKVAERLKIRVLDLDQELKSPLEIQDLLSKLDLQTLWKHKAIPVRAEGPAIICAFANPLDQEASKYIQFTLSKPVIPAIAEEFRISKILGDMISPQRRKNDSLDALRNEASVVESIKEPAPESDISLNEEDLSPIIKLCNSILADAVHEEASDIHIEPSEYGLEVRYRIDGVMTKALEVPKRSQPHVISRLKLLSGMDIAEKRRPQDGRLRVQVSGESVDLRASSIPAAHGEKLVFRLLRSGTQTLSLEKLGLPPKVELSITRALGGSGKLLVVTGPTGSGKTTTLYTCLHKLKDGTSNIITVEDPIEYRIQGINQIQINSAIDVSFASTLRSVLRQDPDVIMIGEIRDAETASIALQSAQTGHLVLSTLHTNDAPSAITRLMGLTSDPYVLASSVAGVLAQRLVRKVCSCCKSTPSESYLKKYEDWIRAHSIEIESLSVGVGCDQCRNTGYKGRVGVYSYLEMTEKIGELIHEKAPLSKILAEARCHGYLDLSDSSIALVKQGITTFDEVGSFLAPVDIKKLSSSAPQRGIKKPKLLLIEDDPDVREILSMLLQKEMYEVIEAENGRAGLEKVYQDAPSIVLCDLMMPVMDGKEFLAKMKSNGETKKIPVLMLTAVDTEAHEVNLLDLGARDFLSKSGSPQVLLTRLRRALEGI